MPEKEKKPTVPPYPKNPKPKPKPQPRPAGDEPPPVDPGGG